MFRGIEAVFKANKSFLNASDLAALRTPTHVLAETKGNWPQSVLPKSVGRPPHALG